jgi:hypothetical protein
LMLHMSRCTLKMAHDRRQYHEANELSRAALSCTAEATVVTGADTRVLLNKGIHQMHLKKWKELR